MEIFSVEDVFDVEFDLSTVTVKKVNVILLIFCNFCWISSFTFTVYSHLKRIPVPEETLYYHLPNKGEVCSKRAELYLFYKI